MRAKKRLGQNFLKNKRILEEIIRVGEVSKKDVILEAGPGHGELTELLARRAKKVIAVEKDRDLIPLLQEKFSKNKNVEICKGDILEFNSNKLPDKNYKLIANIPYYITSRFLRLFLSQTKFRPKLAVLMVQKEVAESLSVKAQNAPSFPKITEVRLRYERLRYEATRRTLARRLGRNIALFYRRLTAKTRIIPRAVIVYRVLKH